MSSEELGYPDNGQALLVTIQFAAIKFVAIKLEEIQFVAKCSNSICGDSICSDSISSHSICSNFTLKDDRVWYSCNWQHESITTGHNGAHD